MPIFHELVPGSWPSNYIKGKKALPEPRS